MSIKEKSAYLKGLLEGLSLDETKPETKIIAKLIDVIDDMAEEIEELTEDVETLNDYIEEIDEDLGEVEEIVYDIDDDDCDCCCDDEDLYEVECPACGEVICIDGCIVDEGEMDCPNCGEHLEFEMDEEEEDEE